MTSSINTKIWLLYAYLEGARAVGDNLIDPLFFKNTFIVHLWLLALCYCDTHVSPDPLLYTCLFHPSLYITTCGLSKTETLCLPLHTALIPTQGLTFAVHLMALCPCSRKTFGDVWSLCDFPISLALSISFLLLLNVIRSEVAGVLVPNHCSGSVRRTWWHRSLKRWKAWKEQPEAFGQNKG